MIMTYNNKSRIRSKNMKDEIILTIRHEIWEKFYIAQDYLHSAQILYEEEKHRDSVVPLKKATNYILSSIIQFYDQSNLHITQDLLQSYERTVADKMFKLKLTPREILEFYSDCERNILFQSFDSSKNINTLSQCLSDVENLIYQAQKIFKKNLVTTREKAKTKFMIKISTSFISVAILIGLIIYIVRLFHMSGYGLQGHYYSDINFSNLIDTKIDKEINFNWGVRNIIGQYHDSVSIRWLGKIFIPRDGIYKFITFTDDGVKLWINSRLVISNWTDHSPTVNENKTELSQGWHDIRLDYYEKGFDAIMQLKWEPPGGHEEVIPWKFFKHK